MSVTWLIDTSIEERQYQTGFPTLADAARQAGCDVIEMTYVPFSPTLVGHVPPPDICLVTHGSIQFCKQIEKYTKSYQWTPALYFNKKVKSWEQFSTHLGPYLLNDDYIILPYGEFVRRKMKDKFIKPLSGLKEFVGQVASYHEALSHVAVDDEVLCVISEPKVIEAEFRYVIANRKVVTGSEYRWDNVLDVRRDTLPSCDALANKIAEHPWQADVVYVCDIAETRYGPRVIELNAFSSSGLYACDTTKIVEAVSDAAWAEYQGRLSQGN